MMSRREFVAASAMLASSGAAQAQVISNSSGAEPPKLKAPANACDAHHHVYDARFPVSPHWKGGRPDGATVADYRLLKQKLGITRSVIVQPSTYGVDNRCLLDTLTQLGADARGVVVIDENTGDDDFKAMDKLGVRGVRVNFLTPQTWGVTTVERLEATANRIAPFGWHAQVLMSGAQIAEHETALARLPVQVVIDHLGRVPQPDGVNHPGAQAVMRLLEGGRGWVKLSEPYVDTKIGPSDYPDTGALAQAYIKAAPERLLWGSDWPHPTEKDKPDDALLLDLLGKWAPDQNTLNHILVDNPAKLFGF